MDYQPAQHDSFLVGTEHGLICRCSASQTGAPLQVGAEHIEKQGRWLCCDRKVGSPDITHPNPPSPAQQTVHGHSLAVYAARWNPCHPRLALSASADWTVKLWDLHDAQVLELVAVLRMIGGVTNEGLTDG